jgi:hypothetical protein
MFSPCRPNFEKKLFKSPLQTVIEPAKTIDYFYAFFQCCGSGFESYYLRKMM